MNAKSTILIASSLLIVIVVLLAIWAVKYYETNAPTPTPAPDSNPEPEQQVEPPITQVSDTGTITSIDDNELIIEVTDGAEKRVVVSSTTPVYVRYISEASTSTRTEISLDRLSVGDSVDVTHRHGNSLLLTDKIQSIIHHIDQPIADYLAVNRYNVMPVIVTELDVSGRVLSAIPVNGTGNPADVPAFDISLAEDITITTADTLASASFSHARTPTSLTLEDINPGDRITVILDPVDPDNPTPSTRTLVILTN